MSNQIYRRLSLSEIKGMKIRLTMTVATLGGTIYRKGSVGVIVRKWKGFTVQFKKGEVKELSPSICEFV